MNTIDRPDVGETNGLVDGISYHKERNATRMVPWTEKGLRITRLRILSDPGLPFWDVSYCHGRIGEEDVDVAVPFFQLPKYKYKAAIVAHAKRDKIYAKGLGIFEYGVISGLC